MSEVPLEVQKHSPPWDHQKGPRRGVFLMSEVPL